MRPILPLALAALLAGCAAPSTSRFAVLTSDSYRCGAAEGLGCGLAIAPVLEQLDALEGVEESRVSWDGTYFRIAMTLDADTERVVAEATRLLEGEACCTVPARGKAAPEEESRWFNAEETVLLSRHEASVIAADLAADVAAEVTLEPDQVERLQVLMREELERAFEQAHAAGGGVPRLWEQLHVTWPRFEARMAELLSPEQCERVSAVLARELEQ